MVGRHRKKRYISHRCNGWVVGGEFVNISYYKVCAFVLKNI